MTLCPIISKMLLPRQALLLIMKLQSASSISLRQFGLPRQANAIIPACSIHIQSAQLPHHRSCVESSFPLFKQQLQCAKYHEDALFVIQKRALFTTSVWFKRKKQAAAADEDTDTDEDKYESDLDSDSGEDDISGEEEGVPKDYKDIHHNLGSLRIDAVLSKGLNISRKKIEDDFLGTKLRLNGSVVTKKGKQVKVGDTLDLIRGSEGQDGMVVSVMRLVVKKVLQDKTAKGNTRVVLRRWKNLKIPKSEL